MKESLMQIMMPQSGGPPPGGVIIVGILLFGAGPSWGGSPHGFPKPSNSLVLSTGIVLAKMSFGFGNLLLIIPSSNLIL